MLYWDLIEEFLPDFEERDNVKFDTVLFSFVHDREVPEEDLPALRKLAKSGWLTEVFFAMEKHLLNEAFEVYFEKEVILKIYFKQKEYGSKYSRIPEKNHRCTSGDTV